MQLSFVFRQKRPRSPRVTTAAIRLQQRTDSIPFSAGILLAAAVKARFRTVYIFGVILIIPNTGDDSEIKGDSRMLRPAFGGPMQEDSAGKVPDNVFRGITREITRGFDAKRRQ